MRAEMTRAAIITAIMALVVMFAGEAYAIDPPHDSLVSCASCHDQYGANRAGGTVDDTSMNLLCRDCHSPSGGRTAKVTHSAITTETSGTYGVWTTECRDCHNPHYQKQLRDYRALGDYSAGGPWLAGGTISALNANVLTVTGTPGWTQGMWNGHMLLPNVKRPRVYRIVNSTGTQLITDRDIIQGRRYAQVGDTFKVAYGMLIKSQVTTFGPITNSSGSVLNSFIYRDVKFFNSTDQHSGAGSLSDTTGVCVVCHTRTKSFNIGYAMYGQSFDNTVTDYVNQDHKNRLATEGGCWANTTGCHKSPALGFGANCSGCHGQPPSVGQMVSNPDYTGMTPGAHAKHSSSGLSCSACHTGGAQDDPGHSLNKGITLGFSVGQAQGNYTPLSALANGFFVNSGDPGNTIIEASGGTRTCANVYCHSDGAGGSYDAMDWDSTPTLECSSCHGDGAGTYVLTSTHPKHATQGHAFECRECHSATVDVTNTVIDALKHVNGTKDVEWGPISSGGDVYGTGGAGTCANIYCHSNGDGGAPKVAVTWGDTPGAGCALCHDGAGASSTLSGGHAAHTNATGLNAGCVDCHGATVSDNTTISDYNVHLNKVKNVVVSGAYGGSYGGGTCSSVQCHGTGSPAWTADMTGVDTCTKCHGEQSASPTEAQKAPGGLGVDTNGDSAATDPQVGAHQAHLTSASNYTDNVSCSDCHNVPAGVSDAGHFDSAGPAELSFSALANGGGTLNPSYDGSTCTNVYCHGVAMPNGSGGGLDNTPVWTDTAYLDGVPDIAGGDCDMCHASPPTGYSGSSHGGTETFTNCNGCHDHINTSGVFTNTALHINGTVEAAGCTGCHGQPPVEQTTLVNNPDYTSRTAGAHQYHWSRFSAEGCGICHTGGGGSGHTTSQKITLGFIYNAASGTYNAPALANGFTLESGEAGTTVNYPSGTQRVCSNIYCHSDGGDYAGTKTYSTADWDGSFSFTADPNDTTDCNKCHGDAGNLVVTDKHPTHAGTYGINCVTCHAGTVDTNKHLIGNHVNEVKDVVFSGTAASGASYSRPGCGTAFYCHSDGAGGAPNTSPTWDFSAGWDCIKCHNADSGSGSPMSSGRHTTHINNASALGREMACEDCHADTASGSAAIKAGAIGNHVNQVVDIKIKGDWTTDCSSVSCHSDGNLDDTPTYNNPDWNVDSYGCASCHGNGVVAYPSYADGNVGVANSNSHNKHVGASGLQCQQCHMGTSTDGTAIDGTAMGNHVNQTVEVEFLQGGSYAGETCSTTYCHGGGTPDWGGASLACDACHQGSQVLPGSHSAHYNSASVASDRSASNLSNSTNYVFNCGVCHDNTSHAAGEVTAGVQTAQVIFNATVAGGGSHAAGGTSLPDASGYNFTNAVCSATYCHSDGAGNNVNNPVWGEAGTGCNFCHSDLPASNAHTVHINNGTVMADKACDTCHSVTATGSTAINDKSNHVNMSNDVDVSATYGGSYASQVCSNVKCHSDGAGGAPGVTPNWYSASIADCAGCHSDLPASRSHTPHVNDGTVMTDKACDTCHNVTASGSTAIANVNTHINLTNDVDVSATYGGTYASNQCSSVYCHSDGKATPQYYTETWGTSGSADCVFCHGGAGASKGDSGSGSSLSVSHTAHTNATGFGFGCQACHTTTATDGATIADTARHINQIVNVAVAVANGGTGTDGGDYSGGACSTTLCHGTSTTGLDWSTGGTGGRVTGDCSLCHGMAADAADGRDTAGDTLATDANVGAHVTHLTNANHISSAITCDSCHLVPAGATYKDKVLASGHLNGEGSANQTWSTFVTNSGNLTPDYSGGTCSATYCHGNNLPAGGNPGVGNAPSWTDTAYLDGYADSTFDDDCSQCHGFPPLEIGAHSSLVANKPATNKCDQCHSHLKDAGDDSGSGWAAGGAFLNAALHINGKSEGAGSCDGCHGYPPVIGDGKTYKGSALEGKGAHVVHVNSISLELYGQTYDLVLNAAADTFGNGVTTGICGACHDMSTSNNHMNGDDNREILVNATAYTFGATGSPTYGGTPNTSSTVNLKSCSNVSCHFQASPGWQDPATAGN